VRLGRCPDRRETLDEFGPVGGRAAGFTDWRERRWLERFAQVREDLAHWPGFDDEGDEPDVASSGENFSLYTNANFVNITAVPEPSTIAMLVSAAAIGFCLLRRKRA